MNDYRIISHPNRLLIDHSHSVRNLMISQFKKIEPSIDTQILFGVDSENLKTMINAIGLFHDLGKATDFFQKHIRNKSVKKKLSSHSDIGAIACANYLTEKLPLKNTYLAGIASSICKNHHSLHQSIMIPLSLWEIGDKTLNDKKKSLNSDFLSELSKHIEIPKIDENIFVKHFAEWITKIFAKKDISLFILYSYLSSLLTWADRMDAVFKDLKPDFENFKFNGDEVDLYRSKMKFDFPKNENDRKRNEFYDTTVKNRNSSFDIIKGRTGIGKTLAYISLALKSNKDRIICSLPFLSIIDQSADVLEKILTCNNMDISENTILEQHHLADLAYRYSTDSFEKEFSLNEADLLINSWESKFVFTTFNSLFESIFTNRRNTRFFRLINCAIILDEIQSIPPKYWIITNKVLKKLVEGGGTYLIYSTATFPPVYIGNKIVKDIPSSTNRYEIELKHENTLTLDEFKTIVLRDFVDKNYIEEKKSILIVMNTKDSAKETYEYIKENYTDLKLYFLSTNLPPIIRRERIEKIKNETEKSVLVSTQLIEAGTDIDYDTCIRDFAPLDSLIQTAGRVNRNNKNEKSKILFLKLKKNENSLPFSNYIYDPVILETTVKILNNRRLIDEKEIYLMSENYFKEIEKKGKEADSLKLLRALEKIDYDEISKFRLIEYQGRKVSIFLELDKNAGEKWKEYLKMREEKSSLEKYAAYSSKKRIFRSLAPYTIEYQVKKEEETMLPPEVYGYYYVSREEIGKYYSEETGFNTYEGADCY